MMGGSRRPVDVVQRHRRQDDAPARIVKADPAVATMVALPGQPGGIGLHVVHAEAARRARPIDTVIQRLRPSWRGARGQPVPQPVQDLQVGGRQTTATYQFVLHAESAEQLRSAGERLVKALKAKPPRSPMWTSTSRMRAPAPSLPWTATAPQPWHSDDHHRQHAL
jgi:multidrug efflux pump subunit AcrB